MKDKKLKLRSTDCFRQHTKPAFGLVEVLVSVVLLTTVIIALSYLSNFMIRSANNASHKTEALGYVRIIIETLRNEFERNGTLVKTSSIPSCNAAALPSSCAPWRETEKTSLDGVVFSLYYSVSNEKPKDAGDSLKNENYYRLDAKVVWQESSEKDKTQVHLTTYLGDIR